MTHNKNNIIIDTNVKGLILYMNEIFLEIFALHVLAYMPK